MTNGNCAGDDATERSAFASSAAMACKREEKIFFLLFRVLKKNYSLLLFLPKLL
jgi:hypothetical protein